MLPQCCMSAGPINSTKKNLNEDGEIKYHCIAQSQGFKQKLANGQYDLVLPANQPN